MKLSEKLRQHAEWWTLPSSDRTCFNPDALHHMSQFEEYCVTCDEETPIYMLLLEAELQEGEGN